MSDTTSGFDPGDIVGGRYRITSALGEGGMGIVYRAEHIELHRAVALKVLLPSRTEDERQVIRFKQEARVAASIGHPGIVEVFDLGEDDRRGETYIAMELLDGEELHERITSSSPLPLDFVTNIGVELADAVAAAHEHGIIHRDLKPQNVFLAREGRRSDVVKVLDFGLAKLVEASGSNSSITRSGELFGTPLFMSPEQLRNAKDIDGRTDVYAIGVILYEAFTGVPPYEAETMTELILKVASTEPPPLSSHRPEIPQQLVDVVERAMDKDRTQRFQSTAALRDALEACLKSDISNVPPPPSIQAKDHENTFTDLRDEASQASLPPMGAGEDDLLRRRKLGAVIAASLIIGAGVLGITLLFSSGQHAEGDRAEGLATGGDAGPDPTVDEARLDEPSIPVTDGDVDRLVHQVVTFVTRPAGAQILLNGERLCEAPCEAELQDAEAEVSAQLDGHVREDLWIRPPIPETIEIRLRRASRPVKLGSSPATGRTTPTKEQGPPPLLPR